MNLARVRWVIADLAFDIRWAGRRAIDEWRSEAKQSQTRRAKRKTETKKKEEEEEEEEEEVENEEKERKKHQTEDSAPGVESLIDRRLAAAILSIPSIRRHPPASAGIARHPASDRKSVNPLEGQVSKLKATEKP